MGWSPTAPCDTSSWGGCSCCCCPPSCDWLLLAPAVPTACRYTATRHKQLAKLLGRVLIYAKCNTIAFFSLGLCCATQEGLLLFFRLSTIYLSIAIVGDVYYHFLSVEAIMYSAARVFLMTITLPAISISCPFLYFTPVLLRSLSRPKPSSCAARPSSCTRQWPHLCLFTFSIPSCTEYEYYLCPYSPARSLFDLFLLSLSKLFCS